MPPLPMQAGRIKIQRALCAIVVLGACAALAAGCGSSTSGNTTGYGTAPAVLPPQTRPGTHPAVVVQMRALRFTPAKVTVAAGQAIEWINHDNVVHNVTSSDGTMIKSGSFGPGKRFEYTPSQPGSYTYYCTIHPTTMQATIVVTRH